MQAKQEMRTYVKAKLTEMKSQQILHSSEKIIQQLMPMIDQYQVWSVFLPMKSEPQIQQFIDLLLARGKTVIVPQVDVNILEPFLYTTDVKIRRWKLGEPTIQDPIPYLGAVDIILVPGLAFTSDGNRLGRGYGYYDTFLAQHTKVKKIWLCFTCQLVDDIPMSEHDMSVDGIVLG